MNFDKTLLKYKGKINKELKEFLKLYCKKKGFLNFAYSAMKDYTQIGGKRLRPIALIIVYKGFGGRERIERMRLLRMSYKLILLS